MQYFFAQNDTGHYTLVYVIKHSPNISFASSISSNECYLNCHLNNFIYLMQ